MTILETPHHKSLIVWIMRFNDINRDKFGLFFRRDTVLSYTVGSKSM